ncbi:hypothetical protein SLE2022_319040 [Rubroshorea leprosula]
MRNCYDSLLSAAAVTANCAYEFSESLREMGSCLLEKTALLSDPETCGWVKNFLAHYMVMSVWVDINGIWVSCNDAAFFCRT